MPDLIRHPVFFWIFAPFLVRGRHAGMTICYYLSVGILLIISFNISMLLINTSPITIGKVNPWFHNY